MVRRLLYPAVPMKLPAIEAAPKALGQQLVVSVVAA
jgi:hypothetical protein